MLNEYEIPTVEDLTMAVALDESKDFENQIDKWDELV